MRRAVAILLAAVWIGLSAPAWTMLPSERLTDPKLEARARAIGGELRCLVCQNQSIDDSNSDLAHDLRVLVRTRLAAGDSDAQTIAYLVARYGKFVLLRPPFEPATYALWLSPALILVLGASGIALRLHRRKAPAPARSVPLSAVEEARLQRLLEERAR